MPVYRGHLDVGYSLREELHILDYCTEFKDPRLNQKRLLAASSCMTFGTKNIIYLSEEFKKRAFRKGQIYEGYYIRTINGPYDYGYKIWTRRQWPFPPLNVIVPHKDEYVEAVVIDRNKGHFGIACGGNIAHCTDDTFVKSGINPSEIILPMVGIKVKLQKLNEKRPPQIPYAAFEVTSITRVQMEKIENSEDELQEPSLSVTMKQDSIKLETQKMSNDRVTLATSVIENKATVHESSCINLESSPLTNQFGRNENGESSKNDTSSPISIQSYDSSLEQTLNGKLSGDDHQPLSIDSADCYNCLLETGTISAAKISPEDVDISKSPISSISSDKRLFEHQNAILDETIVATTNDDKECEISGLDKSNTRSTLNECEELQSKENLTETAILQTITESHTHVMNPETEKSKEYPIFLVTDDSNSSLIENPLKSDTVSRSSIFCEKTGDISPNLQCDEEVRPVSEISSPIIRASYILGTPVNNGKQQTSNFSSRNSKEHNQYRFPESQVIGPQDTSYENLTANEIQNKSEMSLGVVHEENPLSIDALKEIWEMSEVQDQSSYLENNSENQKKLVVQHELKNTAAINEEMLTTDDKNIIGLKDSSACFTVKNITEVGNLENADNSENTGLGSKYLMVDEEDSRNHEVPEKKNSNSVSEDYLENESLVLSLHVDHGLTNLACSFDGSSKDEITNKNKDQSVKHIMINMTEGTLTNSTTSENLENSNKVSIDHLIPEEDSIKHTAGSNEESGKEDLHTSKSKGYIGNKSLLENRSHMQADRIINVEEGVAPLANEETRSSENCTNKLITTSETDVDGINQDVGEKLSNICQLPTSNQLMQEAGAKISIEVTPPKSICESQDSENDAMGTPPESPFEFQMPGMSTVRISSKNKLSINDESGQSIINESGQSIKDESGQSIKDETEQSIKDESGQSIKEERGQSIKNESGQSIKDESRQSKKDESGQSIKDESGQSIKDEREGSTKNEKDLEEI